MTDVEKNISTHYAKPLVTFALIAYNQEQFIREAVEGAFAQTYSPLQIILSDDCSPDRTFEIMEKMAANYAGPHEIHLNRNKQNRGLAGHINQVMSLARGELIVVAAGDDISLSSRVEKNVSFYLSERKPDSIFSDYFDMDENSNQIDERIWGSSKEQTVEEFILHPYVLGAAHAWTSRIFNEFGPLREDVLCEDQVIPFRAYFMNPPKYLPQKLIRYRRLNKFWGRRNFFLTHYARIKSSTVSHLEDLKHINPEEQTLASILEKKLDNANICLQFWRIDFLQAMKLLPRMVLQIGFYNSFVELVRKVRSL